MKQTRLLRTLLVALCLLTGTTSLWAETVWKTYKTWDFVTGYAAADVSGLLPSGSWTTSGSGTSTVAKVSTTIASATAVTTSTSNRYYGLLFQGEIDKLQFASNGVVLGGGATVVTIPNLKAGQRVTVTIDNSNGVETHSSSVATLTGVTTSQSGNYYQTVGIVGTGGNLAIKRYGSTTFRIRSILVETPVGIYATVKMTHISGSDADVDTSYGEETTAYCGYNNISNGTVGLANKGWGVNNIAYLQVDASAVPDGATITAASLEVDCQQISARGLNYGVGYNSSTWSSTMTWNTADRSITTLGNVISGSKTTTDKHNTFDITAAFSGDDDNIVTILVYQTAAGAGYVKNPTVTITYTTSSAYDVTFTETNGVSATVKIGNTDVTSGTKLANGNYNFTATAAGYETYNGNFTVSGANKEVEFAMTAKTPVESLTVKAKIGSEYYTIKTIDLTGKYIGDVVTITYPRLWLVGTTLYSTTQDAHGNGYYKWDYTLDGKDAVVEYNTTEATDVVYYSEGENIEGMTADALNNADIRCSDGKGGRSSEEQSLTSLESGIYKLTSRVWGNSGCSYTYRAAGTDILTHTTTGALNDNNVCFNVLSGTAAIKVQGSGTGNGKVIDYVYIQKLDDSSASIYNGDFENNTWGKGWSGTGTDKAKEFAKQNSSQTWGATDNFAEMWTDGSFSTDANLRQILVNVPAGNYTLSADILNNVSGSGGVLYAKVGNDSEITTVAENGSGANESVSFTVAEPSVVVVGYKTTAINGKSGWIAVDNFELKQFVPATTTSAGKGWATLYTPYALDFTNATPEGLKAYTATLSNNTVTLTEVQNVPAGTGVVLKSSTTGENVNYSIPVIASSTNDEKGSMIGSATSDTHLDDGTAYILGINGEGKAQFFINSEGTIAAGKAYLPAGSGNVEAKALSVVFANDLTGITNANAAEEAAQPAKRIVNGQLVIEKNGKRYNAAGAEL